MMRALFRLLAFLAGLAVCQATPPAKPNIILIFTDDHGWPDLGAAGIHDDLKTPHLDALAASGVRATDGYVTAPQCVPSRAGLLSGRAQNRFGVESNGMPLDGFGRQRTIAERLKEAGYATGQVGKWHLGPGPQITAHGFDDVYNKTANRPCAANYTLEGETIAMQTVDDGRYHLDACSEAALAFIRRHEQQPFFLYLAYRAPHVPLDAPPEHLSRFPGRMPERRRQALAMIAAMDDGVGAIVRELRERNLTEKTLLFFIGDNGAPLKIHKRDAPGGGPGWDGSLNEPMNGEKGMLSEGGIRVPFLVSWPGTIPGGQVYTHPVISLDVAATAVAVAGVPADDQLDGVNLVPFLTGENRDAPHEILTWRWIAQSAIREGRWKLLRGGEREYLFDLAGDPGERENLLDRHPALAERLRSRLGAWAATLNPPGLATRPMAETWERYYDYYHDGKPAPEPGKGVESGRQDLGGFQGWIARGAELAIRNGTLQVTPKGTATRSGPFLVQAKLNWHGGFTATVRLRTATGGKVGVAWRMEGQKDFSADRISRVEVGAAPEWQEVRIPVAAEGKIIHLRLHLPRGVTEVKEVSLAQGPRRLHWSAQVTARP